MKRSPRRLTVNMSKPELGWKAYCRSKAELHAFVYAEEVVCKDKECAVRGAPLASFAISSARARAANGSSGVALALI